MQGLAMSAALQGTPGPGYYSLDYANALVCWSLRPLRPRRPQHKPGRLHRLTAPLTKVLRLPVWELLLRGHTVATRQRLRSSPNCDLATFDYFAIVALNLCASVLRDVGAQTSGGEA